jgi:uncharacterized integral membrane protein (TIGR00697 family)
MPNRAYKYYDLIAIFFVVALITANIIAVKLVDLGGFILPAAVIIFPISYIIGDVLTEVYGYRLARRVIWLGFAGNLFMVIAIWLGGRLPAASFWGDQAAYDTILGFTPRLLIASFIAYLAGEFLNSFVLAKMKIATGGRWLWSRTITSTLVGQLVDSALFISLAFAAILPPAEIIRLVITQWLFKSIYEAVATPFTYWVVNALKRAENEDFYDRETDFNPLKLSP